MTVLLIFNAIGRIYVPAEPEGVLAHPIEPLPEALVELHDRWQKLLWENEDEALRMVEHFYRWRPRLLDVSDISPEVLKGALLREPVPLTILHEAGHIPEMLLARCDGPEALDWWRRASEPLFWPGIHERPPQWWRELAGDQGGATEIMAMGRYLMRRRWENMMGQTRAKLMALKGSSE